MIVSCKPYKFMAKYGLGPNQDRTVFGDIWNIISQYEYFYTWYRKSYVDFVHSKV
jgi:hypothetical protein